MPLSPRRSSRARTTQPPPSVPPHSNSPSTTSSNRADRSTRSYHKQSSPRKSVTPRSLSSEDGDDGAHGQAPEPILTRRRTRGQDNDEEENAKLDDDFDEDVADVDEVTRCICGHQDYPGPPLDVKLKDGHFSESDPQNEEPGGFFIQCDTCKVWQHGGCVGIMEEPSTPDEYFCEECKKELHKVMTNSKGQKHSRYLPVWEAFHPGVPHRKKSTSKDSDLKPTKEKERERSANDASTKRRSTMNSRAAYNDDEILRKVIEESRGDNITATENGHRKGKRGRDGSDEGKLETKRLRPGSSSPSNQGSASPPLASDEEEIRPPAKQKPRGAAARSQREKELRDKEKERQEAAARRKGRVDRRGTNQTSFRTESVSPDDNPLVEESKPEQAVPEVPDPPSNTGVASNSHKKSGRPPARKGKVGRNQYTRDKDVPPGSTGNAPSPHPTMQKDQSLSPSGRGANGTDTGNASDGNKGKGKNHKLERTSMNDLKKKAANMLEFISRTQVDMAAEKTTVSATAVSKTIAVLNGEMDVTHALSKKKDFETLSSLEMMDVLTRQLVLWQQEYGKYGEK
ncbi:hypothetical protein M501DRAFT_929253 [Patellaria atrata CBS 101060]|uniref:Zinc finger PHD-type domain-containing protein n=1 Tax=Patellaria atrata CBS 101060 TaxID=1346257 RepID=A0A9P4VPQ8_9PEZI|nr:hypothetical protein M501DRAFT_929253 [Patellaria atrata CBS 101060]